MQSCETPAGKRAYRWGPGASPWDRHAARGLYGPVKDQQTQTSDTFNFKQQLTPLGTPKDRSVCLAEGGEK